MLPGVIVSMGVQPTIFRKPVTCTIRNAQGHKRCAGCQGWKPESEFNKSVAQADGLYLRCRRCAASQKLWSKYGITLDERDVLIAKQGGVCPVCHRTPTGAGRDIWVVDHDHACCPEKRSCGECVRGVICGGCNMALGHFRDDKDSLRSAVDYLG